MTPFPAYLHEQLEEKLKERRFVVWYDPNREFAPFVEALIGEVDDQGLKKVTLGSQLDMVRRYIANQVEHHRKRSFPEEYREMLVRSGVEFDDRFLW